MKSAILLIPSFLLLTAVTAKPPLSSATSAVPVTDVDGAPLLSGLNYFILPSVSGNGGGVTLAQTNTKEHCPLSVVQDRHELSKGLPAVFLPVNTKLGYAVQTATDLNIEFTAETACDEAAVWKLEDYDDDVDKWFVGTGGIEGKPGLRTVGNWFKIAKFGGSYKIVYCPSVCKSCRVTCKDVGVFEDEDGKKRLALSDDAMIVKFVKAS
ncbi:unnamed protein product [Linum tenue]|uniref:Uncharacterized protein n=1 Tax=Linum tenue TaxID=586396 RepID=A0AAV0QJT0_9ROSI|nr:unnamed protein product [Linum tenue]